MKLTTVPTLTLNSNKDFLTIFGLANRRSRTLKIFFFLFPFLRMIILKIPKIFNDKRREFFHQDDDLNSQRQYFSLALITPWNFLQYLVAQLLDAGSDRYESFLRAI